MIRAIIDCDPGIDDALALILALKSGELKVEAVTTVGGNMPVEAATENALKVLELIDRTDIPVAAGLNPERTLPESVSMHGEDGLGNTWLPKPKVKPSSRDAIETIISVLHEKPAHVITLGPLTNIASAIEVEPEIKHRIESLTVMGGAVSVPGNITPVAEFNIYMDPEAARKVLRSGIKVTLVPLDVTMQTMIGEAEIGELEKVGAPAASFAAKALKHYLKMYRMIACTKGCPLHDPLTVAYRIDPTLMKTQLLYVDVETKGELTRGETVADLRTGKRRIKETNVEVCLQVDAERFIRKFIETVKKT
ncbi:nucleoside hydrolase [Candidatus Bathyarchaeota archaeon]|nr:nucleoside hydrolase [Candidatus Bathyarchaeota archaeon]